METQPPHSAEVEAGEDTAEVVTHVDERPVQRRQEAAAHVNDRRVRAVEQLVGETIE